MKMLQIPRIDDSELYSPKLVCLSVFIVSVETDISQIYFNSMNYI